MHFYQRERIVVFIDGANTFSALRALGFSIDYKRLLTFFRSKGHFIRAYYYTVVRENEDEYSSLRPLVDWLRYNGFTVVMKPAKQFTNAGVTKFKGDIDVEMAVGALQLADGFDHAVFFTGDGNFCSLVEALQMMGKRVTVVSTLESNPPMVADEIRRQADQFIDLADLERDIGREPDPVSRSKRRTSSAATD